MDRTEPCGRLHGVWSEEEEVRGLIGAERARAAAPGASQQLPSRRPPRPLRDPQACAPACPARLHAVGRGGQQRAASAQQARRVRGRRQERQPPGEARQPRDQHQPQGRHDPHLQWGRRGRCKEAQRRAGGTESARVRCCRTAAACVAPEAAAAQPSQARARAHPVRQPHAARAAAREACKQLVPRQARGRAVGVDGREAVGVLAHLGGGAAGGRGRWGALNSKALPPNAAVLPPLARGRALQLAASGACGPPAARSVSAPRTPRPAPCAPSAAATPRGSARART
jgi:hypothetical protein